MKSFFRGVTKLGMLAVALILIGCSVPSAPSPAISAAPTIDINPIRTEVAQTVVAMITQQAALNPTSTTLPTEIPPSNTPLPSSTATEAQIAVALPTETPVPTFTTTVTRKPAFVPSATSSYVDQAAWISNSPKDGTTFKPSTDFDAVWTIKNIGRRTWNKEFYYRWAGGNLKGALRDMYYIPGPVAVNDTVKLIVDMVAPSEPGRYTSYWELVNDDGVAFFRFYLVINVAK